MWNFSVCFQFTRGVINASRLKCLWRLVNRPTNNQSNKTLHMIHITLLRNPAGSMAHLFLINKMLVVVVVVVCPFSTQTLVWSKQSLSFQCLGHLSSEAVHFRCRHDSKQSQKHTIVCVISLVKISFLFLFWCLMNL